ncbi:hypothetical protein NDU88_006022 [Pleurodeles waltl]|uniref:Uncharacterized protein n=1 Tax=Pleurodeles waltl TaxID=8319 RepID=A0AAV7SNC5_PLEWA|nr:hypothetical protein NDU88_006022 [Pleurodeles waltl]
MAATGRNRPQEAANFDRDGEEAKEVVPGTRKVRLNETKPCAVSVRRYVAAFPGRASLCETPFLEEREAASRAGAVSLARRPPQNQGNGVRGWKACRSPL